MKKLILLFIIFLVVSGDIFAQTTVGIFAGIKPITYSGSSIQFYYRDESPAPDDFYTDIDLSAKTAYNVSVSFNNLSKEDKRYRDYVMDLYFGDLFLAALGASIGYPYFIDEKRSITLLPLITGGLGLYRKQLGELENYTTWITVNDVQFANYENVNISLSGLYGFIKPAIQLLYDYNPRFQIVVSCGFMLGFDFKPRVDFAGTDQSGESALSYEGLNDENIAFYVDYDKTNDPPFKLNGIEFKIGIQGK